MNLNAANIAYSSIAAFLISFAAACIYSNIILIIFYNEQVTLEFGCVLKNIRRGSPRRHAHRRLIATNWSDFTAF